MDATEREKKEVARDAMHLDWIRLQEAGFKCRQIASLYDTTAATVASTLSLIRREYMKSTKRAK